jgi:hypothetical protein
MSPKVRVCLAELGAFPIYDKAQVIQVRRGDSLKIPCKPPTGVPYPETYWTDSTNTSDQFGSLISNPRIQQDYYGWSTRERTTMICLGNLYFST